MTVRAWILGATTAVWLVAAAGAPPVAGQVTTPIAPNPGLAENYVIGVGNVLRLVLPDRGASYSGDYVVEEDGMVYLPPFGAVEVVGLTLPELRERLRTDYRAHFSNDPAVVVTVMAYFMAAVMGEVAQPGNYQLPAGSTSLQAVAAAGGFRDNANERGTYLLRGQQRIELGGMPADDDMDTESAASVVAALGAHVLSSGDAVVVPRASFTWLTAGNLFTLAQFLVSVVTLIRLF
ncbi:MAG: polysaccharide biosynthesis/export family protein [Gemmatimonadota bacterium]